MTKDLSFPKLDSKVLRAQAGRHLLALSGGGYRGLFTAKILDAFEKASDAKIVQRFDGIAGTSIGGILAIGLANEISAGDLSALVKEYRSDIFRSNFFSLNGKIRSRYSASGLREAIKRILGPQNARRPFSDIQAPLIVCAVDEVTSRPRIFRTKMIAGSDSDDVPTIDVALATSAAPTFFPAHVVEGRAHIDGGLIANAPDLTLVAEMLRRFGGKADKYHLLSIGTAGSRRAGGTPADAGGVGWVARHKLVQLIMGAQEELAIDQVRTLGLGSFLRIDETPETPIELDQTDDQTSALLEGLAHTAIERVEAENNETWRRFAAYRN